MHFLNKIKHKIKAARADIILFLYKNVRECIFFMFKTLINYLNQRKGV
jgi:hypothetical protein